MCVGEEIWHLLEIALSQSIRDRPQGIHNPPSHFIDEDTKVQAEKVPFPRSMAIQWSHWLWSSSPSLRFSPSGRAQPKSHK